MNPSVSIVCASHREDPAFEWLADALASQLDSDDEVEVVLVDGLANADREARFVDIASDRFPFTYAAPKPSPFIGPYRLTKEPLFAVASARNTGIVLASHPYIAFIDDCSVPMPGWWETVREAARHQYVVAGAYQKHWEMEVVNGQLESSRSLPEGIDSRWELGDDTLVVPIRGGQLYGCSVGLPRDLLLDLNGFDELCDGVGQEDCHLGVRVELAGQRLFYSRRMLTIESEDLHKSQPSPRRIDPTLPEAQYLKRLADYGVTSRSTDGRLDASHMMLDLAYGLQRSVSLGNNYTLTELVAADLESTALTMPTIFWFDGTPMHDL